MIAYIKIFFICNYLQPYCLILRLFNTEKTSIIPPHTPHYKCRGGDKMSRNSKSVPEAKAALDQFKYEVASEIGVPLKKGYNGDLTSAQNGSVGGYMVKFV